MNLFGEPDFAENESAQVKIPNVAEFSRQELMAMEKDTTGLYPSGHPMDEYRDTVRRAGAVPIGAIMADFASDEGNKHFSDG